MKSVEIFVAEKTEVKRAPADTNRENAYCQKEPSKCSPPPQTLVSKCYSPMKENKVPWKWLNLRPGAGKMQMNREYRG